MPHSWIIIRLGRICSECSLVQAKGEFDDGQPCPRDKAYDPDDQDYEGDPDADASPKTPTPA